MGMLPSEKGNSSCCWTLVCRCVRYLQTSTTSAAQTPLSLQTLLRAGHTFMTSMLPGVLGNVKEGAIIFSLPLDIFLAHRSSVEDSLLSLGRILKSPLCCQYRVVSTSGALQAEERSCNKACSTPADAAASLEAYI